MTNRHVLYEKPGGYEVYVDLIASMAGSYISHHPYIISFIKEVLADKRLAKPRLMFEHDMGRVIGNTDIIKTDDNDTIFYAIPVKKSSFGRYAKNRYSSPSRKLTLQLERDNDGNYELLDTWIGPCSPPFPGHEGETDTSKAYWLTHALAHDTHALQSRTITKICPY